MDRTHNILIISDLHLGEDLKISTPRKLRHVAVLERELSDFLGHYTESRRDGRPWELLINGDTVDFLSVCLMPQPGDPDLETVAAEDHVYGLGTQPEHARRKMHRVLERHPGVFRALARFIAAGNRLAIIAGNHDVEFHWPAVQEQLKKGIAAFLPEHASDIEAGISFHPWFYFQENVVWVEHGHQYDEYCSFDYILNPVSPAAEEVVLNVGAAGYRYVSNQVPGADPHQQEDWNALGYIRFSLTLGARGCWRMARGYAAMVLGMLSMWRVFARRPADVAARRKTHLERLHALTAKARLSEETLLALDDLRRRPVVTNFVRLAMAVMLDRVVVMGVTALLVLGFVVALPWVWALGAVLVGAAASQILSWCRGHTDPHDKMRAMPQKIRGHVRAPFVVFGHSHHPLALPLEDGGWYFNTGTWVATEKPGLLRAFTHVIIRHVPEGLRAALCQWREGKSHIVGEEARVACPPSRRARTRRFPLFAAHHVHTGAAARPRAPRRGHVRRLRRAL